MCLVIAALDAAQGFRLVLAANRDEHHARPTTPAAWWRDVPTVLGGRDLVAGGTWLAVDRRGRVAAVTNIRDPHRVQAPRSRGELVADYLRGDAAPEDYAAAATRSTGFAPFNLLVFAGAELHYASNRAPAAPLAPGIHVVSNVPRGVEWPKVATATAGAAAALDQPSLIDAFFALLARRSGSGGVDSYRHDHFVVGDSYGTRCSSVFVLPEHGPATFVERTFDATGRLGTEVRETFSVAAH